MDRQNKDNIHNKKETQDTNLSSSKSDEEANNSLSFNNNLNNSDHNYSSNSETSSTSNSKNKSNSSYSNVSSSENKDDENLVTQGRSKKRLKGSSSNENVISSSSNKNNLNDQVTSASSSKKNNNQRYHHNKKEPSSTNSNSSSSQMNSNSNQISSTNTKTNDQVSKRNEKMDADQSNVENDSSLICDTSVNNSNDKKINSGFVSTASTSSSTLFSTSTSNNYKDSSKDNSNLDSSQNLPRIPPLRIVITNSNSSKKDNEKLVTSSNVSSSSLSTSLSQINCSSTSSEKSFSIENTNTNRNNTSINVATSSTSTSTNSVATSSSTANSNNLDEIDSEDTASSSYNSKDAFSSTTNTSTGRVTRSSQRAAAQQSTNGDDQVYPNSSKINDSNESFVKQESNLSKDFRKRKNRFKNNSNTNQSSKERNLNEEEDNDSTSSSNSSLNNNKEMNQLVNNQLQCLEKKQFQMPSYNCYHLYLNIRRQVDHRRSQQIQPVHPKIPENFNQFLFNTGSYLLDKNNKYSMHENNSQVPRKNEDLIMSFKNDDNFEVPRNILNTNMYSIFLEQDLERRKLSLQHRIEKDKLRLSAEQEILRVYARAELAIANLNLPLLSACTVLKDEEIYNSIDEENDSSLDNNELLFNDSPNEFANPSLNNNSSNSIVNNGQSSSSSELIKNSNIEKNRYNTKLLNSWLKEVNEKWSRIKQDIILRQKREAESLQAVQKLNWQWKGKELDFYDCKISNFLVEDKYVPLVQVIDDFDLLPTNK